MHIVGIGASAGGISALKKLFQNTAGNTGVAFVIVVHLSPEHESHLEELLQPHVQMPVRQVTKTVELAPDHVYLIPPNANLATIDTHLRLSELEQSRRERAPIDHFFRTLAETHEGHAIGVVLTGMGSDGTLGLRAIRGRGGLTIVQDPKEAEYDSMPQSAVMGAPVDLVLPLAEILDAALRFARTAQRLYELHQQASPNSETGLFLQRVFSLVRARTGRDFTQYKHSTLSRRIARRMQFRELHDTRAYLEILRTDPEEADALADDLLITVTNFFRDPEVFDRLEQDVIPSLFSGKGPGETVRVWSVGCATGEEAYSLAILLAEEAARHDAPPSIQVFASDLHTHSLDRAREALYPGDIEVDIGPERLARYFLKENDSYRVRKDIREMVLFAAHNVLSDPPFSRVQLISCRNMMIYLQRDLQQQVVELFHYSLQPGGYLLLGTSENVGQGEIFRTEDKKTSIYRKRNVPPPEPRLPVFPLARSNTATKRTKAEPGQEPIAYEMLHRLLLDHQGPPSVLVSSNDNVVHFSSRAGRYFVQPGGIPTPNLFRLIREPFVIEARAVLHAAREQGCAVRSRRISLNINGTKLGVVLDARPSVTADREGFVLLLFDEHAPAELTSASTEPATSASTELAEYDAEHIRALEKDKRLIEQRLQSIIEEYETSQEVVRASNEELQSTNEELRSTLEELETSKEELQSVNEELQTVNQENRHKVEELDQLSSDLHNLLVATDIATLFLDRDLRILRFTPKTAELFNIRMEDRGRALSDFTSRLGYGELQEDARQVLRNLIPVEREVVDEQGNWHLTRVLPYRSREDRIAGVVVTFVAIAEQKAQQEQLRQAKEHYEQIIQALPEPLLVLDAELRIESLNAAFLEHFHTTREEGEGLALHELGQGMWDVPELRQLLESVVPSGQGFSDFQLQCDVEGRGKRALLVSGRRLANLDLVLLGIRDVTEQHDAELARLASDARLAAELKTMQRLHELAGQLSASSDREEALLAVLDAAIEVTGGEQGHVQVVDATGECLELAAQRGLDPSFFATPVSAENGHEPAFARAWRTGSRVLVEDVETDRDSESQRDRARAAGFRAVQCIPLTTREGVPLGVLTTHRPTPYLPSDGTLRTLDLFARQAADLVERKRGEDALRSSEARLGDENRHKDEYLAMLGHELRNPLAAMRHAIDLLQHPEATEAHARAFDVLDRRSQHMTRLIDGLLDVSRIARNKLTLERCPVEAGELLARVAQDNSRRAEETGLQLEVEPPADSFWVDADEVRLVQVLDNLFHNALKFTRAPGSITLTVTERGKRVVFGVRDTGQGIREEALPHIFETFRQEGQGIARNAGGLGLGLALAKGIVELHEGTLTAHSAGLGQGALFEISLLRIRPPSRLPEGPASGAASLRRILVVEDDRDAGALLCDLLKLQGHDVHLASSGPEALQVLAEHGVDVVLCDLGLPGMSGCDLARALRSKQELEDVVLVAVTGYGRSEDRANTSDAGFDAHLTKPVNFAALQSAIATQRVSEPRSRAVPMYVD